MAALVPTILNDGYRIDILLNCAGVQKRHQCHRFPTHDWNEVDGYALTSFFQNAEPLLQILQVNLTAVFTLCRDVGAHMLGQETNAAGRRGSIINVASLLSFQWVFSSLFSPNRNKNKEARDRGSRSRGFA